MEFDKTGQEARTQCPLRSLSFSGRWEKQDGHMASDWPRLFRLLPRIQRNLRGSKISMSSTEICVFRADYFINEKFNKNAKVEKLTKQLGRSVRLIVKCPYRMNKTCLWNTDAPGGNKVKIWQKYLSPTFWPRPTPRGMWCQWCVRNQ